MEKYLSIPVTNEGNQLVTLSNVKLIEVGDVAGPGSNPTTTTTIYYGSSKTIEFTHAAVPANSTIFRNYLQTQMRSALSTSWTNVSKEINPAYAVSNIDIA
jgi:hypothetical protein|tara:strand:- start:1159 stop:1461 length:303 start_codon:yes stop_codon:yes gene_type:complete